MEALGIQPVNNFSQYIVSSIVHNTSYEAATEQVIQWAKHRQSYYVCVANVHMLMEAWDSLEFAEILQGAALVTPDGMPLVWALRLLGFPDASRVYGPTLTLHLCKVAAEQQIPIGLYGGTEESLQTFSQFLKEQFPDIQIACAISPPFRPLTPEEDETYTQQITNSGARILFVGIGCPRQEFWMAAHQDRIPAVMLGVGAAFDFHSGRVKQAPSFLQNAGLEWAFRFAMEPRRLWKRYVYNNPRFIFLFVMQWIAHLFGKPMFGSRPAIPDKE
jgi:N-acetylglucosaminyldiphosphoundecaprenol N-acetyl-beta-D-mannosaminyltransferase